MNHNKILFRKPLIRTLILCIVILIATPPALWLYMKRSLAPLDGQVSLSNLTSPVRVLRDNYGIPHIYAKNKKDALRALGFVTASERLFQMEISRRLTQGHLAEIFGEVALKSDKLYRSLGLRHTAERMLEHKKSLNKENKILQEEMEAYCDGINQYMASHPLPYDLALLGIKPKPFTPMDAYVMIGQMAFSFGVALKNDILMTELASKISDEVFQDLRNDHTGVPLKTAHLFESLKPLMMTAENQFTPYFDGSNSWLVSAQKSASGKSIFANDPHIGFPLPAVWFEAHIHTPQFELYGHYLPLVPFAILGHSRHHAWGFTMLETDDMDLYRETLDKQKKSALFNDQWQPYHERSESILVKDHPSVDLQIIETTHGPLMDAVLDTKNLALKWAFYSVDNDPIEALYKMGEARNIHEFEASLKTGTAPGLNVMYADPENIAWWTFGEFAIKKNPNSDLILDGAHGQDEYLRVLDWSEKPHSVNPKSGFIVTANSRPSGIPAELRGDWQADDRYQTISQNLSQHLQTHKTWQAADFKTLQTLNFNQQTEIILKKLLEKLQLTSSEQKQFSEPLRKLTQWNHHSELNSEAASLYHLWNSANIQRLLSHLNESEQTAYLNTTHSWMFYKRVLFNENSPWWKEESESKLITEGFKKALQQAQSQKLPKWGHIHTIEYTHPLGRSFPLNLFLNLGPYPIAGAYNEVNNNKQRTLAADSDGNFKVLAGPSTRRIIDFAEPQKSWGINPIGNSGHLLSPYYKDQVQMFLNGEYRLQLMDETDITKTNFHELILK